MTDDPAGGLVVTGIGTVSADGFDFRTALGRRGYKYLPAASQYFLAAAKVALAQAGPDALEAVGPEERGAAVGTNSAAVALHHMMDRTITATGAEDLSPALAPYFSINLFGSRLATEHDLKGFNLTFTSPRVAGLEALQAGRRAIATGRARRLLAGATEEALPEGEPGADRPESGAVALVLEPASAARSRGAAALGRVAVRSFFLPPRVAASADGAGQAAALLRDALAALGHRADRPLTVTAVLDGSPVGEAVAAALAGWAPTGRASNDRAPTGWAPDDRAVAGQTLNDRAPDGWAPNDRAPDGRPVAGRLERVPAGAGALEPMARVAAALAAPAGHPHAVVTAAAEGNTAVCLVTPGPGPDPDPGSGADATSGGTGDGPGRSGGTEASSR
ncbi:beta-ketoacyl synthase N-terminal-like domain-containing protein [Streptomyces sp. SRF1]|uniref:beta-ketoacyl synthase N-terminal-like domain-containing protein n=1 Tax=Streptomyces sp. SRF1 TaxID=1549642 RepID=UPI0025AF3950|nr:beta-ketoacyl synthase N-terminal-like domain-containing protein [Streptomyces sp. SRF1]MDN3060747.1 beta-ketoacyl synthase N-terminal-like domain-containing protein [Streptomyces sp. SRF1]